MKRRLSERRNILTSSHPKDLLLNAKNKENRIPRRIIESESGPSIFENKQLSQSFISIEDERETKTRFRSSDRRKADSPFDMVTAGDFSFTNLTKTSHSRLTPVLNDEERNEYKDQLQELRKERQAFEEQINDLERKNRGMDRKIKDGQRKIEQLEEDVCKLDMELAEAYSHQEK